MVTIGQDSSTVTNITAVVYSLAFYMILNIPLVRIGRTVGRMLIIPMVAETFGTHKGFCKLHTWAIAKHNQSIV